MTGLCLSLGLIFSPYAIGQIQYDDIISDPYFFENSEDYSYLGKILVQARPEGLHGDSAPHRSEYDAPLPIVSSQLEAYFESPTKIFDDKAVLSIDGTTTAKALLSLKSATTEKQEVTIESYGKGSMPNANMVPNLSAIFLSDAADNDYYLASFKVDNLTLNVNVKSAKVNDDGNFKYGGGAITSEVNVDEGATSNSTDVLVSFNDSNVNIDLDIAKKKVTRSGEKSYVAVFYCLEMIEAMTVLLVLTLTIEIFSLTLIFRGYFYRTLI